MIDLSRSVPEDDSPRQRQPTGNGLVHTQPPDCGICAKILAFCHQKPGALPEVLGTLGSLMNSPCSHVDFFRQMSFENEDGRTHYTHELHQGRQLSMLKLDYPGVYFHRSKDEKGWDEGFTDMLHLVRNSSVFDHPGYAKLVDTQWIDTDLVQAWIRACDRDHPACKDNVLFQGEDNFRPRYLVDVCRMCVVPGSVIDSDYVALSYQWGQTLTLRNCFQICDELRTPGSLLEKSFASQIPQTIRDAFAVTRRLGYQYLWVDALCIVSETIT